MCNYIYGFIPPSGVCSEGPDAVYCFLSKEGGDLFWIRTGRREGMFGSNLDLIAIGSFRAAHSFFCIIIIIIYRPVSIMTFLKATLDLGLYISV